MTPWYEGTTVYGSLRPSVSFGGDGDSSFAEGGSRWGVMGGHELSEGLSAVYRFEQSISTSNAEQGPRLAYAGVSGGFGSLSVGQLWSASFNHVGSINDKSWYNGVAGSSFRLGNAVSYAYSSEAFSMQVDAVMDSKRDTGDAVDQMEFGMTIGLGEIGKVALSYVDSKDTKMKTVANKPAVEAVYASADPKVNVIYADETYHYVMDADGNEVEVMMIEVSVNPMSDDADTYFTFDSDDVDQENPKPVLVGDVFLNNIIKSDGMYHIMSSDTDNPANNCDNMDTDDTEACPTVSVWVSSMTTGGESMNPDTTDATNTITTTTTEMYYLPNADGEILISDGDDDDQMPMEGTRKTMNVEDVDVTPGAVNQTSDYVPASTVKVDDITPGYKQSNATVEFGLGGITAWLGMSKKKTNAGGIDVPEAPAKLMHMADGMYAKKKGGEVETTYIGVSGAVGDSGLSYVVQGISMKDDGKKTSPWLISLTKSLGDGASAVLEYHNTDAGSNTTQVGLVVNF